MCQGPIARGGNGKIPLQFFDFRGVWLVGSLHRAINILQEDGEQGWRWLVFIQAVQKWSASKNVSSGRRSSGLVVILAFQAFHDDET